MLAPDTPLWFRCACGNYLIAVWGSWLAFDLAWGQVDKHALTCPAGGELEPLPEREARADSA